MGSIEQDLLRETRLSTADLTRAVVRRQEMGNRLETTVLELGLLSEAELAPALTAHYGLPAATAEELRDIPEPVQALLSASQAGTYRAVPFAAGTGRADIATAGTLELERADELAFLLGRRVRLFVINEVRIAQALQRYYALPQAARLLNVADRLDRGLGRSLDLADSGSRPVEEIESPMPEPSSAASTLGRLSSSRDLQIRGRRVTPPKPRETLRTIPLSDEERAAIFGPETAPEAESEPPLQMPASELARLSHELQEARSPTDVGAAFLRYLEGFFHHAVLLRPEGELFRGWQAYSSGADGEEPRSLMTGPGLAAEWAERLADHDTVAVEIGPSAEASGFDKQLATASGETIHLVPIRVQGRVVSLAVGAPSRELERNEKELLANASLRTGLALQSWILKQKHYASTSS